VTTRVFIIPAALKEAGDAMSVAMGWGGPVFVQPLSADGQEPPTHWGFPAVVGAEFMALWDNPPPEAAALVAAIEVDTREGDDTAGHWWDALAAMGLTPVPQDTD
jgi:hypothetical protein